VAAESLVAQDARRPDSLEAKGIDVSHEVQVVTTSPRSTAVVARATTWAEFPKLWGQVGVEVNGAFESDEPAPLETEVHWLPK